MCKLRNNSTVFEELEVSIVDLTAQPTDHLVPFVSTSDIIGINDMTVMLKFISQTQYGVTNKNIKVSFECVD